MGNEMGFPAPWAYNWAGKPASTQYVVHQLLHTAFGTGRDGLPGNDDMGAESSWYVFASLGMFPTSQADAGLALSTPQFPSATVHLGNHRLRIRTDRDASGAPFIRSLRADGTSQSRSWLPLDTLRSTNGLHYTLSTSPTGWASTVAPTGPAAAKPAS
jgi:putative alpha-1,2-mannosidase